MAVLEGKTFMNVPGVVIICTEIELCFVCPIKCIDTISDAVVLCAPPRSLALWLQKRASWRQIFQCANSLAAERRLMLELRDAFAVQLFTWTGKCHISVCNHHLHTLVTHTAAYIAVFGHALAHWQCAERQKQQWPFRAIANPQRSGRGDGEKNALRHQKCQPVFMAFCFDHDSDGGKSLRELCGQFLASSGNGFRGGIRIWN